CVLNPLWHCPSFSKTARLTQGLGGRRISASSHASRARASASRQPQHRSNTEPNLAGDLANACALRSHGQRGLHLTLAVLGVLGEFAAKVSAFLPRPCQAG